MHAVESLVHRSHELRPSVRVSHKARDSWMAEFGGAPGQYYGRESNFIDKLLFAKS